MIVEAEMSHEEMQRMIDTGHLCAECGSLLTIAWGGYYGINSYILRCGTNIKHNGITGHDKVYEKKMKEYFSMESKALMVMDENTMLKRVEMARFPQDLTLPEKKLLAQVAITYGFDPLMGEVTIYQGRPFVSIDGRYRKAQESGLLDGVETRPANKQERIDWGIPDGDYFFRSEIYVKGATHPFVAWGRVHKAETLGGKGFKPVEKNPQRMAEKRAEAQGLRKGFHIPLPSAEEIGSPEYEITVPTVESKPTPKAKPEDLPNAARAAMEARDAFKALKAESGELETTTQTVSNTPAPNSEPVEEEDHTITPGELFEWIREEVRDRRWYHRPIKKTISVVM